MYICRYTDIGLLCPMTKIEENVAIPSKIRPFGQYHDIIYDCRQEPKNLY